MERTHIKIKKVKYERLAVLVPDSRLIGNDSSHYPSSPAVPAAFKTKSSRPLALRDDDFDSCQFSLTALLSSTSTLKEPQAKVFALVEKIQFLEERTRARGAYQYTKKRALKGQNKTSI